MLKKTGVNIIVLLFLTIGVKAQQYPYFTHYSFNKFVNNPAAAGVNGNTTISLIAREQWVGQGGTPKTHALIFDSRILGDSYIMNKIPIRKNTKSKARSGNTAWGASIINDANGPINRTWINGTYAYHIDLGEQQLSFGLSLLLFQNRLDGDQLIASDNVIDPLINGDSFWVFDANFGAFLSGRDYYAGYSTVQLFNSSAIFGVNNSGEYKLERQHNLMGGYKFYVTNRIDIEPSVLLKIPESFNAQVDISAKVIFDKQYWGGLNYKTGSAIALFGGLNYDKYYFGYAFEYDFNSMAKQTLATHEIIIIARFGDAARRYKWLNSY